MKLFELIIQLNNLRKDHGDNVLDMPVILSTANGGDIETIGAYVATGPDGVHPAVVLQ